MPRFENSWKTASIHRKVYVALTGCGTNASQQNCPSRNAELAMETVPQGPGFAALLSFSPVLKLVRDKPAIEEECEHFSASVKQPAAKMLASRIDDGLPCLNGV